MTLDALSAIKSNTVDALSALYAMALDDLLHLRPQHSTH
jgi:hypothetical protein